MKAILYIMLLIFVSCGGNNNSNFEKNRNEQTQKITNKVKTINELKIDLRKSMIDYIKTGNANYNEKDVKKCISIIDKFLIDIKNSKSKEDGLLIVKNTVLQLNNINKKTNFSLIETMERENIAEIINLAGYEKGYNSKDEDITEQWREW